MPAQQVDSEAPAQTFSQICLLPHAVMLPTPSRQQLAYRGLSCCRLGLASVLHVVVCSLEELFVERCHDLITTAALRAMGGCKKLKVCSLTRDSMPFRSQARSSDSGHVMACLDDSLLYDCWCACGLCHHETSLFHALTSMS